MRKRLVPAIMLIVARADVPPPGLGFMRETVTFPICAISSAEIWTDRFPCDRELVVTAAPLTSTSVLPTRPIAAMFRTKAEPPAITVVLDSDRICGTGPGGSAY